MMLNAYNEVKKVKTTARKFGIPAQTLRGRVIGLVDSDNCAPGPDFTFLQRRRDTCRACFDISRTWLWLHQCSAATSWW